MFEPLRSSPVRSAAAPAAERTGPAHRRPGATAPSSTRRAGRPGRRRPGLLTLVPALLALVASAGPAGAALDAAQLVRSDAAGSELVFEVPEPVVRPAASGHRIEIDGYLPLAAPPGAPLLPGTSVLVAVPAGSTVRHRVTVDGVRELTGIRPEPVADGGLEHPSRVEDPRFYAAGAAPAWVTVSGVERLRDLDVVTIVVRAARFDPVAGATQVAGRVRVVLETSGGRAAAPAAAGRLPAADLDLYSGSVLNADQAAAFRHASTGRRSLLDRGELPGRSRASAPQGRPGAANGVRQEIGFASAPTWVRLGVDQRSMTYVRGEDLAAAGIDIAAIDPATLRVFWGGGLDPEPGISARAPSSPSFMQECAIEVGDGGTAGQLDADDTVAFLGNDSSGWLDDMGGAGPGSYGLEAIDHLAAPLGVYWLTWGGDFPAAPLRIGSVDAMPAGGAPTLTTGRSRTHYEQNRVYNADFYEPGERWEKWWYATTVNDQDLPVSIPISTPEAATGALGTVRVRLWGNTIMGDARPPTFGGIHDHYVVARWNGEIIHTPAGQDTFIWDGADRSPYYGRQDIQGDGLDFEAANTLTLEAVRIVDPAKPNRIDESLLAWYQVVFERRLDMTVDPSFEFASPEGANGTTNFEITSVPAGTAVYDVTDPFAPRVLDGELDGTTLRFSAFLTAGETRKYWVGRPVSFFRRVASVERDTHFGDLRDPGHRGRYLVIAHDTLLGPSTRLGQAHATLPGDPAPSYPMVVRTSDIYDEFGWGLKSATAVRNFVDYAVHTWQEDGRPLYVCLVGDASYDALDRFGDGSRLTDLVPAPSFWNFIGGSFGGSDFISDDWYVRTFGDALEEPPDILADLYIGRIPARTLEEAEVIIDGKTIPFLSSPERGDWRQRVLLAADDQYVNGEPVEGFRHVLSSERVLLALPTELELQKIYLHDYPLDEFGAKPEARTAYLGAFDAGAALVNYIGHGAPDVMAHEALFRVENTGQLANGARLPLFFTFSCTVNRFDEPASEGIGEALVKHPDGGSVTSTGATDLAFVGSNQRLNTLTFERLYVDGDMTRKRPIGAALGDAKNIEAGVDTANVRKYVLLGDPAVVIPTPTHRIEVAALASGGAGAPLDTLVAGVPYVLGGIVRDSTGTTVAARGQALVRVTDSSEIRFRGAGTFTGYEITGRDVFRSELPVTGGTLETGFVVPVDAYQSLTGQRGLGGMKIYADLGGSDACGARSAYLNVVDAGQEEPPVGPVIEASFDTDPDVVQPGSMLHIQVSDPSGINIVGNTPSNALFMRIDEELTLVLNELFTYAPGSATEGSIDYPLPALDEGPHVARIFASDNYLNRSRRELEFNVVAVGDLEILGARLYPNPFDPGDRRGTVLGFEIREPARVDLRILTISGRLVRETFGALEDELAAGRHQLVWDGRDEDGDFVANGVYLLKIQARSTLSGQTTTTLLRSVVSR